MSFNPVRPGSIGSRHWRVWLCYYLAFLLIHIVCFHGWLAALTPNSGNSRRPLGVHAAYAWGWVSINTNSGIYRHPGARWYGNTQEGKYRPEWFAKLSMCNQVSRCRLKDEPAKVCKAFERGATAAA